MGAAPPPPPRPPAALPAPSPPPSPLASTALPPWHASVLLDAVVYAAAEAMAMAPQVVRPAVLAAFVRARDVGMTMEGVIAALS